MHSKTERRCRAVFNKNAESNQEYFFGNVPVMSNIHKLVQFENTALRSVSFGTVKRNLSLKRYESTGCATPSRKQYVINYILTPLIKRDAIFGSRRWIHSTLSVRQWSPSLSVLLSLPLKKRTNCKNSLAWRRLALTLSMCTTWSLGCRIVVEFSSP